MTEYSKKLHINYNGTQTDIKLYTTTTDVGSNYLSINDGISNTYAKLDTASGTNLHIRKNGTVYNIIQEAVVDCPTGSFTPTNGTSWTCPAGVHVVLRELKNFNKVYGVTPGNIWLSN